MVKLYYLILPDKPRSGEIPCAIAAMFPGSFPEMMMMHEEVRPGVVDSAWDSMAGIGYRICRGPTPGVITWRIPMSSGRTGQQILPIFSSLIWYSRSMRAVLAIVSILIFPWMPSWRNRNNWKVREASSLFYTIVIISMMTDHGQYRAGIRKRGITWKFCLGQGIITILCWRENFILPWDTIATGFLRGSICVWKDLHTGREKAVWSRKTTEMFFKPWSVSG